MEVAEQPEEGSVEQAERSVEDRIGDMFAGPEHQEAAEEAVQPEEGDSPEETVSEEFEEVEFNGHRYQVPPELKDALMATSDYTQKTQALADQRRNVELQQKNLELIQEQNAFQESVREEVSQIQMYDQYIAHAKQNTNWADMSDSEIMRARIELENLKDQRDELQKSVEGKYQQFQAGLGEKRERMKAETDQAVAKAIPGWSGEVRESVQSYVKNQGYPDPLIGNMSALDYQIAYKAMQFDQLKAGAVTAVQQAEAPPVIKPTARNEMPKAVQDKLNYRNAIKKVSDPRQRQKLAEDRIGSIFNKL